MSVFGVSNRNRVSVIKIVAVGLVQNKIFLETYFYVLFLWKSYRTVSGEI